MQNHIRNAADKLKNEYNIDVSNYPNYAKIPDLKITNGLIVQLQFYTQSYTSTRNHLAYLLSKRFFIVPTN